MKSPNSAKGGRALQKHSAQADSFILDLRIRALMRGCAYESGYGFYLFTKENLS
jgi:hypothetical protein